MIYFSRGTLPNYASQMAGMTSGRHGSGITGTSGGGPGGIPVGGNPAVASSGLNSTNHVVPNLQSMRRSSPNSSSQYSQWRIQKDLGGKNLKKKKCFKKEEYFLNLSKSYLLHQIFVYLLRHYIIWLLAFFW